MAYGQHLDVLGGIGGGSRRRRMLGLQTGLVASERAAVGPNLPALGRAEGMRRQQMGALSRGSGYSAPVLGGRQLRMGQTHAIGTAALGPAGIQSPVSGAGVPSPGMAPIVAEAPGSAGPRNIPQGGGYVRLSGSYKSPEEIAAQQQTEGAAFQQRIASPYDQSARAAVRAQYGPGMRRERAMGMAPPVQGIEDIATGQALGTQTRAQAMAGAEVAPRMAEAETAGMEAEARGVGAQADIARSWVDAIQQLGPEGLIATMNQGNPLETAATLGQLAAQAREAGDEAAADWFQRSAVAASGGQVVEVPDPGIIARVTNFINALVGSPYRVDFGGRKQTVVPGAPTGRAAAMGGVSGPTAGAQAGVGDQDERELWERLRAKYGG